MLRGWLDSWDESRARRGEVEKQVTEFALDAGKAFPNAPRVRNIEEFCVLSEQALADPTFFDRSMESDGDFESRGEWLRFPSDIITDVEANNLVWAKITRGESTGRALVVFHHWNATARNRRIAKFLSQRGITVVELAMPYHLERSRPGSLYADYMLSSDLGRTIQSLRQAVLDGRKLIGWLRQEGYQEISLLGMSLGSWVAGLIAAHDPNVSKASLFLTAGSLADMVWTGRASRSIRDSLASEITLTELRRAWGPLNLENYAKGLARPDLRLHIVLAKRDKVVLPELSKSLVERLSNAGADLKTVSLNCGHYSLALPPYILQAGLSLNRFLPQMDN